jgi:hypothetical protein
MRQHQEKVEDQKRNRVRLKGETEGKQSIVQEIITLAVELLHVCIDKFMSPTEIGSEQTEIEENPMRLLS